MLRCFAQRQFVIRAAIKVMEYRRRQAAFRNAAKVHDVVAFGDIHGARIARGSTK
jgi:hypothetical protein